MKIQIKLSTPKEWLNLKPTNSPQNEKPHAHYQIMIMEGCNEDMEMDVIT
jgi:hypothetical protein